MRIAIASVQVPFIFGGAEHLVRGLRRELLNAGHEVDLVTLPFRFSPPGEVARAMEAWCHEDLEAPNGVRVDRVICIKFPSYYVQHPRKILWLAHQHRSVYELWDTMISNGEGRDSEDWYLRWMVREMDQEHLKTCEEAFTISKTVSGRLRYFNGIDSAPLYHPPPLATEHSCQAAEPFIFFPSRLEPHKRQRLLIEAMHLTRTKVKAVIAGGGGLRPELEDLIEHYGLWERVELTGIVSDQVLLDLYSRCLAVFFGPYAEDYGYVTLEAMLSSKPVITCSDSGGPLEFVVTGETGLIVDPSPEAVAAAIDRLVDRPEETLEMGRAGRRRYDQLGISWSSVVEALTR